MATACWFYWKGGDIVRKYRSYKFTNKQHSQGGIKSGIAAAVTLICTLLCVYFAYMKKGEAGKYVAVLGIIAMIGSIYGAITGKRSFREEECYYFFSWVGTSVNVVLLVFWIGVVGMGFLI